jgi:hypothetical protein
MVDIAKCTCHTPLVWPGAVLCRSGMLSSLSEPMSVLRTLHTASKVASQHSRICTLPAGDSYAEVPFAATLQPHILKICVAGADMAHHTDAASTHSGPNGSANIQHVCCIRQQAYDSHCRQQACNAAATTCGMLHMAHAPPARPLHMCTCAAAYTSRPPCSIA